ncbi:hypothetical protein [Candidatus Palauibacter sp.]|uniref:hypothetical protein n=1 Tax=Candidatus Palauibacter sp. TaxID=3101350 RepID=UPI003B02D485
MRKIEAQDGLHVCLDMPEGGRAVWSFADSTERGGWGTAEIETIKRLRPHMRQFVRVRQTLAAADALGASLFKRVARSLAATIRPRHNQRHSPMNGGTGAPMNDWKSNLPWFLAGAASAALVTVLLTTGPGPQSDPSQVEAAPRITNPVAPGRTSSTMPPATQPPAPRVATSTLDPSHSTTTTPPDSDKLRLYDALGGATPSHHVSRRPPRRSEYMRRVPGYRGWGRLQPDILFVSERIRRVPAHSWTRR